MLVSTGLRPFGGLRTGKLRPNVPHAAHAAMMPLKGCLGVFQQSRVILGAVARPGLEPGARNVSKEHGIAGSCDGIDWVHR